MTRFPEKVETTADALDRLQYMLEASSVLSKDFRGDVLSWAYKAVELAHHAASAKPRDPGIFLVGDLVEDREGDKAVVVGVEVGVTTRLQVNWDCNSEGPSGRWLRADLFTNLTERALEEQR